MAIRILRCPCNNVDISGKVKVVKRGLPTGPEAEQAATDRALKDAAREAARTMRKCRCAKPCILAWKKAPKIKIRSSGSQNNPRFAIIGAAVAVWTVYPICGKPNLAGAKPGKGKPKKKGPKSSPLNPAITPDPYPFKKDIVCGAISILIAHGDPNINEGSIVFDFKRKAADACDCDEFGWIQHFKRANSKWRYDNGMDSTPGLRRVGALSDPTLAIQPTQIPAGATPSTWPENPWYGAWSGANPPPQFDRQPTPQNRIADRPSDRDTSYVTQLVCVKSGEVLFSWFWGPVPDGNTPLESVPAGPTPPP